MLQDLDTPALLLDAARMERNCEAMRTRVHSRGVVLRPHVKTAKSVEVTQRALAAHGARVPSSGPYGTLRAT